MSTSIHSGLVTFTTSVYGSAADPVDNAFTRDGLANGLLHIADSLGQVRVNWQATTYGGKAAFSTTYDTTNPRLSYEELILAGPFGPWPITLKSDGTPYRLRIRLAGSISGSAGFAQVRFRVVLAPAELAASQRTSSLDSVWVSFTSTSTTAAWLSGDTNGALSDSTIVHITADQAAEWTRLTSIYDGTSSSSPKSIDQCLMTATVFGENATGGSGFYGRLHALHIQEYVGT